MKTTKHMFMLLIISFSTTLCAANLEGIYDCQYTFPDSKAGSQELHGRVTLEKSGDVYTSKSSFEDKQFLGTGIYDETTRHLSLVWTLDNKLDQIGLLSVVVESDTDFSGKWVFLGSNKVGTQACHKVNL